MRLKKSSKVFSVRVDEKSLERWQRYAKLSGARIADMVEQAMNEYIDNYPLTGIQAKFFDYDGENDSDSSVQTWIREEAYKQLEFLEQHHNCNFSDEVRDAAADQLVSECMEGWRDYDELDDSPECEWKQDQTLNYIEERAEDIVEELSVREDEAF